MKSFKKENNKFKCEECSLLFTKKEQLSKHITLIHGNIKKYFDKWIKEKKDGICKTCKRETKFNKLKGYKDYCSVKCSNTNLLTKDKIRKTNINKYGVKYPIQSDRIKEKGRKTCLEKYGVEFVFQSEEIKEKIKKTNLKKYGVENPYLIKKVREKALKLAHTKEANENYKNTCLEKFGVENPYQSEEIKEKIKKTNLKKFGFEFTHQNINIFEKSQKSGFKLKQFRDTNLWYQGSYELDFLEKYYDKYSDIQRGPSIKYYINDKKHFYHPDFYIPSLNLIIECKSTYFYNRFLELNKEKERATVKKYNYKLIIDKNGTI